MAVVDTEKSTIEVEVFESGVIGQLLVAEGEEVPVGTPLATITAAAPGPSAVGEPALREPVAAPPGPAVRAPVTTAVPAPAPVPVAAAAPAAEAARPPAMVASPVVRRLAGRTGVDLGSLTGTGPGGRVTRHDVEAAAAAARPAAAPGRPWVRSSPRARRLAQTRTLDLAAVPGTGPGGAVTATDVECFSAAPTGTTPSPTSAPPQAEEQQPVPAPGRERTMRRAIGNLMARSKREIPHYYLSTTADLAAAEAWMTATNENRPVTARLILPVLLVKAVARAVAAVPEMNGFWIDDSMVASPAVHVGVAVSMRQGGLIAPAIHDADRLPLDEMAVKLRDLVTRARAGRLRSSEMSDPTITVTNLGDLGVESVFGVIYPPQVALVGFGRVVERPWAHAGMIGVRPCTTVTLSADHRASDGHRGGRFLARIVELLQHPEEL